MADSGSDQIPVRADSSRQTFSRTQLLFAHAAALDLGLQRFGQRNVHVRVTEIPGILAQADGLATGLVHHVIIVC